MSDHLHLLRYDRGLYLHFLNRELLRAVDGRLDSDRKADLILLASIATGGPLYATLAFVWEGKALTGLEPPILRLLSETGQLERIGEYPTIAEFVWKNQNLYKFDRRRYPMYFERIQPVYLAHPITLIKGASTTEFLDAGIRAVLDEIDPLIMLRLSTADLRVIRHIRQVLRETVESREQDALTVSLFRRAFRDPGERQAAELAIARLLSTLHLEHYLDFLNVDVLTGIEQVRYFDKAGRRIPEYDARYWESILRRIGLSTSVLRREVETIVTRRRDQTSAMLRAAMIQLIGGLYYVARRTAGAGAETRQSVDDAISRVVGDDQSRDLANRQTLFEEATGRVLRLRLIAERHAVFAEWVRESGRRQTVAPKVLILGATDIELRTTIELLEQRQGSELGRVFLGDHTVWAGGLVRGVEVVVARSLMGTEAPGAMTLTAVDIVDYESPDFIILIGIAVGLRPEGAHPDGQKIGDVLVSRQLQVWDVRRTSQSDGEDIVTPRGDKVQASGLLLDRFLNGKVRWRGVKVHDGLVLSANELLNSEPLVSRIRLAAPDAIGYEMEGAGVYCVGAKRKKDWIVVKGIADWGYNKSDGNQEAAARNAVEYAFHVLDEGGLA